MSKDFEKFIYKKVCFEEPEVRFHLWYLIDKKTREGVHFHGQEYRENYNASDYRPWYNNQHRFSAHGIEMHKKTPVYEGQKPLENCDVTGGDCYCDGSSLQASEQLGHINPNKDDDYVWSVLHYYFGIWIEEKDDA